MFLFIEAVKEGNAMFGKIFFFVLNLTFLTVWSDKRRKLSDDKMAHRKSFQSSILSLFLLCSLLHHCFITSRLYHCAKEVAILNTQCTAPYCLSLEQVYPYKTSNITQSSGAHCIIHGMLFINTLPPIIFQDSGRVMAIMMETFF